MTYLIIPELVDIDRALALSTEYGVNFEYNDFARVAVYEDPEEVKRRVRAYKAIDRDRSNDTMHGAFLGLDLAAADSVIAGRSKELYCQSLAIANELGLKGVVFHTGLIGGLRLPNYIGHWLDESAAFWMRQCENYPNLTIYMENTFEREPDALVALMQRMWMTPNFKLCLDYAHAALTPTPLDTWVEAFAPYIGHMHVNDNDLVDDLHLAPGMGKIDYAKWKTLMEKHAIDVSVLLELNGYDKAKQALDYMLSM